MSQKKRTPLEVHRANIKSCARDMQTAGMTYSEFLWVCEREWVNAELELDFEQKTFCKGCGQESFGHEFCSSECGEEYQDMELVPERVGGDSQ